MVTAFLTSPVNFFFFHNSTNEKAVENLEMKVIFKNRGITKRKKQ